MTSMTRAGARDLGLPFHSTQRCVVRYGDGAGFICCSSWLLKEGEGSSHDGTVALLSGSAKLGDKASNE